jgi:hypothetical protein
MSLKLSTLMTDPDRKEPTPAAPDKSAKAGAKPPGPASEGSEPIDVNKLSAEEQMALFEKDLKENDWGHQPC